MKETITFLSCIVIPVCFFVGGFKMGEDVKNTEIQNWADKNGHGVYYLDDDNIKKFRWIGRDNE